MTIGDEEHIPRICADERGLEPSTELLLGLTKGLQALMKGKMDLKFAGMYFYGLQIVASIMGRVNFGETE